MNPRFAWFAGALAFAVAVPVHAGLENPTLPGSIQSGVSVVSGFHCTASRIQVAIDSFAPLDAATRTSRNDAAQVCGRADTGFSLLFNYNILSPGTHRMRVLADGQPFAEGSFEVVHYGTEFLTGAKGGAQVLNFPELGTVTTLAWDEEKQNFSIASVVKNPTTPAQAFGGRFWGVMIGAINNAFQCGPVPPVSTITLGSFDVAVAGDLLTLSSNLVDGRSCTASGAITPTYGGWNADETLRTTGGWLFARLTTSACNELRGIAVAVRRESLRASDGFGTEEFQNFCANSTIRATR
jgi:hypothetical protein